MEKHGTNRQDFLIKKSVDVGRRHSQRVTLNLERIVEKLDNSANTPKNTAPIKRFSMLHFPISKLSNQANSSKDNNIGKFSVKLYATIASSGSTNTRIPDRMISSLESSPKFSDQIIQEKSKTKHSISVAKSSRLDNLPPKRISIKTDE